MEAAILCNMYLDINTLTLTHSHCKFVYIIIYIYYTVYNISDIICIYIYTHVCDVSIKEGFNCLKVWLQEMVESPSLS